MSVVIPAPKDPADLIALAERELALANALSDFNQHSKLLRALVLSNLAIAKAVDRIPADLL